MNKMRFFTNVLSKWLYYFLAIAVILMIGMSLKAVVLTFFNEAFPCKFTCTKDGMLTFLDFFKPFYPLFSGTALLVTLYVALVTYIKSKQVEAVKGLQELRKMLDTKDNMRIHDLLEWDTPEEQQTKEKSLKTEYEQRQGTLYNYLGILELAQYYIEEDIIDSQTFNDQFGYRVVNAFQSPYVRDKIFTSPTNWKTLMNLFKKVNNQTQNYEN